MSGVIGKIKCFYAGYTAVNMLMPKFMNLRIIVTSMTVLGLILDRINFIVYT